MTVGWLNNIWGSDEILEAEVSSKESQMGRRDRTESRALAWYVAGLGFVPGAPTALPGVIP